MPVWEATAQAVLEWPPVQNLFVFVVFRGKSERAGLFLAFLTLNQKFSWDRMHNSQGVFALSVLLKRDI